MKEKTQRDINNSLSLFEYDKHIYLKIFLNISLNDEIVEMNNHSRTLLFFLSKLQKYSSGKSKDLFNFINYIIYIYEERRKKESLTRT